MIHVTEHAIDRYCERFAPVGRAAARRRIASAERAIETAAAFGAHTVRIGNGAKLVIRGTAPVRVITVLERRQINPDDVPRLGVVCCGSCGLRTGDPVARCCTRVDCPLQRGAGA
jgi:hypothetical protein